MTAKKKTKKKKTTTKAAPAKSGLKKTKAELVGTKSRASSSMYDEIIKEALTLKSGECVVVPVPDGVLDTVYRNRLSVVIARKVKPFIENDKAVVRLYCTDNNEVSINLLPVE